MRAKGESLPLNKILRALRIGWEAATSPLFCEAGKCTCENEPSLPRNGIKPNSSKKNCLISQTVSMFREYEVNL